MMMAIYFTMVDEAIVLQLSTVKMETKNIGLIKTVILKELK